jgi:hypothetical protein
MLPNAMVATLTFLPFILSGSITTLTSLDFLGLRPAARMRPRWVNCSRRARKTCNAPWLGLDRLHDHLDHALAADLYWRGGARCLRSAKDLSDERRLAPE